MLEWVNINRRKSARENWNNQDNLHNLFVLALEASADSKSEHLLRSGSVGGVLRWMQVRHGPRQGTPGASGTIVEHARGTWATRHSHSEGSGGLGCCL